MRSSDGGEAKNPRFEKHHVKAEEILPLSNGTTRGPWLVYYLQTANERPGNQRFASSTQERHFQQWKSHTNFAKDISGLSERNFLPGQFSAREAETQNIRLELNSFFKALESRIYGPKKTFRSKSPAKDLNLLEHNPCNNLSQAGTIFQQRLKPKIIALDYCWGSGATTPSDMLTYGPGTGGIVSHMDAERNNMPYSSFTVTQLDITPGCG